MLSPLVTGSPDNRGLTLNEFILNENVWILNKIWTEIHSQGFNWQYPTTGADNDSAPIRPQAIIQTDHG